MRQPLLIFIAALAVGLLQLSAQTGVPASGEVADSAKSSRNDEMLAKMRAAVEEIAELYGNPPFVQIFTNSRPKADELRARLRQTEALTRLKAEMAALTSQEDRLSAEVAQKQQEAKRLGERIVRQRTALESVSSAIEASSRAVEATSP